MSVEVKVIEDSQNVNGDRVTTLQLRYPRMIHSEVMTHRVFSRNASSSRAIPTEKAVKKALDEMIFPVRWGKNQPGMQPHEMNLSTEEGIEASLIWQEMAEACAEGVLKLAKLGVHKQWANRPLEWFSHISVVLTSTDWDNFFLLRDHSAAQDEFQILAGKIKDARNLSVPRDLGHNQWHLPYVRQGERSDHNLSDLLVMSAARCARVSYDNHDGSTSTLEEDQKLFNRLVGSIPQHMSPVEHQAMPAYGRHGNFLGWKQLRQFVEDSVPLSHVPGISA